MTSRRTLGGLAIAAVACTTVAGCGGGDTAARGTGSSSPARLDRSQSYRTVADLAGDLSKHGHTCTGLATQPNPTLAKA